MNMTKRMPTSARLVPWVSLMAAVALIVPVSSCMPGQQTETASIRLGMVFQESAIPFLVAENQGLFTRNGININFKYYDSGAQAVAGMLNDEIDLASSAAEYVLASQIMGGKKIQTIGSFDRVEFTTIIARKDRGITSVAQLYGKRIGVLRGSAAEFYLGRFLSLNGMDAKSVTLVNMTNAEAGEAVVSGTVDAIITVPPFAEDAISKLGDVAITWKAQATQLTHLLILCQDQWALEHKTLVVHLLSALEGAEDFIAQHPVEAKSIAKKELNVDDSQISVIWARNIFGLSLDQSLIAAMEDEARWMIKNSLTAEKDVPLFNSYIYEDALKAIKPEAVNIIR